MKENMKKGFTLVELLAVIVILIVLFLLGLFATNKYVDRSRKNSFVAEANVIVKGALERYSMDRSENDMSMDLYSGKKPERACYSIENALIGTTVTKADAKGYTGTVEVCSASDCEYNTKIWLNFGDYYIEGVEGEIKFSDIKDSYTTQFDLSCGEAALYGGTECDDDSCDYDYNGSEYTFVAPYDGVYSLETWGAQGGYYRGSPYNVGGYGGYAYGEIELQKGDKLYVVVGGKGDDSDNNNGHNGYNGGGVDNYNRDNRLNQRSGGGGATHIAYASGVLSSLVNKKDYIIMVAGGGGGASHGAVAGGGGGIYGGTACGAVNATQTSGYAMGEGAPAGSDWSCDGDSAGGGGYYGASIYNVGCACDTNSAGGGSGYINYPTLRNKYMYGYNVTTSDEAGTKTYTTTNVSDRAIKNYAKRGDGFARITYLGTEFSGD